jgi:major cell surface glycoprotein (TIGR04216 family)
MTRTKRNEKLRALFLSALMVVSVFGATMAFTGSAAAGNVDRGATTGTPYDTDTSSGTVDDGAVVFQGEEDLNGGVSGTFGGTNLGELQKTSGSNEGILLQNPIPQDQDTGQYTADGSSSTQGVTLQTPRITDVEIQTSPGGSDVAGGVLQSGQSNAVVTVEYNFEVAENIELTVEDENGLEVTSEILDAGASDELNPNGPGPGPTGSGNAENFDVAFEIDPGQVDEGEYTVTVEGNEDLDFGQATQTETVEISADRQASLTLGSEEATQGENVLFDVENSNEGNFHPVVIEPTGFRDVVSTSDLGEIFRSVGDTTDRGVVVERGGGGLDVTDSPSSLGTGDTIQYAFAFVEIDGGTATGSIETQLLDDTSVDVDLFGPIGSDTHPDGVNLVTGTANVPPAPAGLTLPETEDEQDLDVVEGGVSLNSPTGAYIVGSEVDVEGTANEGVDEVAIYARDNNNFELVEIDGSDTIEVEGDDSFSEEDITLNDASSTFTADGNDILSLPGTYRLGVIDAQDADVESSGSGSRGSGPDAVLTTSEFNSGASSTSSLRVRGQDVAISYVSVINGQVAIEDADTGIEINGTASGQDDVSISFYGPRGTYDRTTLTVDSNETFESTDLQVGGNLGPLLRGSTSFTGDTELSQGRVIVSVFSSGVDGVAGDGELNGVRASDPGYVAEFISFYKDLNEGSFSQQQVIQKAASESTRDTASDDISRVFTFRLAEGQVNIDDTVGPAGVSDRVSTDEELTVSGTTNRQPEDNTITVELQNDAGESVALTSTDQWGTDGRWSAELDLTDVEPGNYTVEADDGDNADRANVQVLAEAPAEQTLTMTETTTPAEDTATPAEDTAAPTEDTATPAEDTAAPTEDTATPAEDTATPAEDTATTEGQGSPGFGIIATAVALLAAALLALRQRR